MNARAAARAGGDRDALERDVRERFERIAGRIQAACARVGRDPRSVTLVGVSKKQSAAAVAAGVRAGVLELGENFVQEARDKQPEVHGLLAEAGGATPPAPRWRMIGRLQRNKARVAARIFDAVDTIDRLELAEELGRRAEALGRVLEICIQVNVSGEAHKGGVAPAELPALLDRCRGIPALRVAGLMAIPAAFDPTDAGRDGGATGRPRPGEPATPAEHAPRGERAGADPPPEAGEHARPAFARLRELRDSLWPAFEDRDGHSLATLSMGMSADFEVAIEEGATHVRVGTALFGTRPAAERTGSSGAANAADGAGGTGRSGGPDS